ncbi:hypothetical protein M378DRAFT_164375 [Amanita muscaria Koide BX008]|uniref:Uncharacterized protein n=1 Tax=Amanita muscaria (strain Koide BX008) TaxID=946122 RepID=A0A0C2X481_AMAMK|nr:hypothetical protein M378DRAFT_164375 [Amanita muscaria Koide BX008]
MGNRLHWTSLLMGENMGYMDSEMIQGMQRNLINMINLKEGKSVANKCLADTYVGVIIEQASPIIIHNLYIL